MKGGVCWRCRLCGQHSILARTCWPDRMRLHYYDCPIYNAPPKRKPEPLREHWTKGLYR